MLNLKGCHLLLLSGKRWNDFTIFFLNLNPKTAPRLYFLSKIWKIWIQKPPLDCLFWSRFLKEKKGFLIVHRVGARQQRLKEARGTKNSYPIWFLFLFLFLFHCHFFFPFPFPFLFLFFFFFFLFSFFSTNENCAILGINQNWWNPQIQLIFFFLFCLSFSLFVCLSVRLSFFFFRTNETYALLGP